MLPIGIALTVLPIGIMVLPMTQPTNDDDWLTPEPDSVRPYARQKPKAPVFYRIDAHGERPVKFRSLAEAILSCPPMTPEAEIRGPGGVHAEPAADRAVWVCTNLGCDQVEREIRGAA